MTKPYLGAGSFAGYATVATAIGLAHLPDEIDFTRGAALGLAGVAAVQVVDAAELQPGQTVLVVGATGGVGTQVVQVTAQAGCTVIAIAARPEEQQLVSDLGAKATVDYHGDSWLPPASSTPTALTQSCTWPATQPPMWLRCALAADSCRRGSTRLTRCRAMTSPVRPSAALGTGSTWCAGSSTR